MTKHLPGHMTPGSNQKFTTGHQPHGLLRHAVVIRKQREKRP